MNHDAFDSLPEGAKVIGDIASAGTLLATLASWLPNIAALLTIIWTLVRLYESRTVRGWLGRGDN